MQIDLWDISGWDSGVNIFFWPIGRFSNFLSLALASVKAIFNYLNGVLQIISSWDKIKKNAVALKEIFQW